MIWTFPQFHWQWPDHTHYLAYMCFIMLTQVLGEHTSNFDLFGPSVRLSCLDTFIQTYIHTHTTKYILKCVHGSDSLGPSVIQKFFFWHFFFSLHINEKRCSHEGFLPCCSHSQIVYAYQVSSWLLQGFVLSKYHFGLFFGPDMKMEMDVVIYMCLKHSPGYIDCKYMWVHWSNPLGSRVFAEIPCVKRQ